MCEMHLADSAVSGAKLAEGSVGEMQLAKGAVSEAKLSFTALQTVNSKSRQLQQFGLHPFHFEVQDESVEIQIPFEQPFADAFYVVVAMTNHTACYTVVKQKAPDFVTLQVVRSKFSPEPYGIINWLAVGTKA